MPAGQPPVFKSPEELQQAIDDFIADPPTRKGYTKDGNEFDVPIVTITRLCYELGFASRQSFYDYEKHDEYSYTIKRARLYIESEYEANLSSAACTGSIFALKNMGWKDKSEQEITASLDVRDVSQMTDEEIENELNR